MNIENQNQYPASETTLIQSREELMTILADESLIDVTGGCGGGGGGGGKGKRTGGQKKKK